jgi:hypothetical protein
MSDYREVHEQAREHGLKARHETRVERAIRRQVAEECAQAIERLLGDATHCRCDECRVLLRAELVDVLAVASAWVSSIDRKGHLCCDCVDLTPPLPCCNPGHGEAAFIIREIGTREAS